jgi:hypothetical protein
VLPVESWDFDFDFVLMLDWDWDLGDCGRQ